MGLSRKKRNIVTSRLKAFYSFSDTFQSALKSGWKVIRSGWSAGSSLASVSDPSTYPILSTTMASANVTIDVKNPGIGTGPALWVTSSGEWYGLVTSQNVSVGSGNCSQYNPYNPCGTSNPVNPCAYYNNPYSAYDPPSGGSWNPYYPANPSTCCNPYTPANPATCCNAVIPGYSYSDYCGETNPYVCNPVYYICYGYNPYNAYNCGRSGSYYACGGCNSSYGPYGGNCSGGNCRRTTVWVPASGGNPIPGNAAIPGNPIPGNAAIPSTQNAYYAGGWYIVPSNNCVATGGNCQGTGGSCNAYNNTYPRYLNFIKYASNVVTQVYSFTLDSVTSFVEAKGLRVTVSNATKAGTTATITAKVYSDEAMLTQIGSNMIYNATGVKINTNYGIIASPSNYNQGNSVKSVSIS